MGAGCNECGSDYTWVSVMYVLGKLQSWFMPGLRMPLFYGSTPGFDTGRVPLNNLSMYPLVQTKLNLKQGLCPEWARQALPQGNSTVAAFLLEATETANGALVEFEQWVN